MIRILPRYVLRELLAAFVLSLVLIVSLVIAGLALQLIYRGLDVVLLRQIVPYLVLYALPHALPAALLTAAVMAFGRLSGDNEITAIRSSGVHLHVVVMPALLAGLVATIGAIHLNCNVVPRTYFRIDAIKQSAGRAVATSLLRHRRELIIPPFEIKARAIEGDTFKDVTIIEYDADYVKQIWSGREAVILDNPESSSWVLELRDCDSRELGYRNPTEIRMYSCDKIRFPVGRPGSGQSRPTEHKHMDMRMLLAQRGHCARYMTGPQDLFADPKRVKKATKKEVSQIDVERSAVLAEEHRFAQKGKELAGAIAVADTKIETATVAIARIEQKASAAKASIAKAQRELKPIEGQTSAEAKERRAASNRTIREQQAAIEQWERETAAARQGAAGAAAQIGALKQEAQGIDAERRRLQAQAAALMDKRSLVDHRYNMAVAQLGLRQISAEAHERVAMAFSCLTFMLVGVPLGLIAKRGNILIAFAVSFFVVLLVYYPLVLGGRVLIEDKYWAIPPLIWAPNAVLALLGTVLLWRLFRR